MYTRAIVHVLRYTHIVEYAGFLDLSQKFFFRLILPFSEMSDPLAYEKLDNDFLECFEECINEEYRNIHVTSKGKYFKNFGDSIREMEIQPADV